jgi:uncharacterized DUF497 family protein
MKFDWNPEKNRWLKENRDISFDEITCLIEEGRLIGILRHTRKEKQKVLIVERDGYAYNIPFIEEDDGTCFLKTIYPSRASTKKYLKR